MTAHLLVNPVVVDARGAYGKLLVYLLGPSRGTCDRGIATQPVDWTSISRIEA